MNEFEQRKRRKLDTDEMELETDVAIRILHDDSTEMSLQKQAARKALPYMSRTIVKKRSKRIIRDWYILRALSVFMAPLYLKLPFRDMIENKFPLRENVREIDQLKFVFDQLGSCTRMKHNWAYCAPETDHYKKYYKLFDRFHKLYLSKIT